MKTSKFMAQNHISTPAGQEIKLDMVADRLRKSRDEWESAEFNSGHQAGRLWAAQCAEHVHLRNLEDLYDSLVNEPVHDWEWYFEDCEDSAYGTPEYLASTVLNGPDGKPDRTDSREMWESIGTGAYPTGSWLKGFCEGALALFGEVREQI